MIPKVIVIGVILCDIWYHKVCKIVFKAVRNARLADFMAIESNHIRIGCACQIVQVISIDVSPIKNSANTISKKSQINVCVLFWFENRIQSRFFA